MKNKYISIALVISIIILLFSSYSFIKDAVRLYTNGTFVRPSSLHNFYRIQRRPATPADVNLIALWMTFNYINKSFSLSPDYLKTALNISDKTYPNLTISKMATKQGVPANTYLEKVKNYVLTYLTQNTPPK